jgi:hypothetical protein
MNGQPEDHQLTHQTHIRISANVCNGKPLAGCPVRRNKPQRVASATQCTHKLDNSLDLHAMMYMAVTGSSLQSR